MDFFEFSEQISAQGLYELGAKLCEAELTGDLASLNFEQTMSLYQSIGGDLDVSAVRAKAAFVAYRFVEYHEILKPLLPRISEHVLTQMSDPDATATLLPLVVMLGLSDNWVDTQLVMGTRVNAARVSPPPKHKIAVYRQRLIAIGSRRYMVLNDLRKNLPIPLAMFDELHLTAMAAAPRNTFVRLPFVQATTLANEYPFIREYFAHKSDLWLTTKRGCRDIVALWDPPDADELRQMIDGTFARSRARIANKTAADIRLQLINSA